MLLLRKRKGWTLGGSGGWAESLMQTETALSLAGHFG